ncbi:MAG: flagellar biosynthesis protein FlgI [Rhodobacteraceae bacterium]|nr:flagellar biosynthesis protein FlgI [Paracoccaceae bacterium]
MFRFGKRQTALAATASSGAVLPTAEDMGNIKAYTQKIQEVLTLLSQEISAIKAGELDQVTALFEQKTALFKWLELRTPLIEPFLNNEAAKQHRMDDLLKELRDRIEEDTLLLSRMASAAKAIVREMEKANERRGLDGLYGQSGKLSDTPKTKKKGVDTAL